jgi:hypothetical protein
VPNEVEDHGERIRSVLHFKRALVLDLSLVLLLRNAENIRCCVVVQSEKAVGVSIPVHGRHPI